MLQGGSLAKEGHAKDETGLVIWLIAVWPHGRGGLCEVWGLVLSEFNRMELSLVLR